MDNCRLNCRVHRYVGPRATTVAHRDSTFLNCVFETGPGLCIMSEGDEDCSSESGTHTLVEPPLAGSMTVTLGLTAATALEYDRHSIGGDAKDQPPTLSACRKHFAGSPTAVQARAGKIFSGG
jgi:hypothetical protein